MDTFLQGSAEGIIDDPSGSQDQLDVSAWELLRETASPITPDPLGDLDGSLALSEIEYAQSSQCELPRTPDDEIDFGAEARGTDTIQTDDKVVPVTETLLESMTKDVKVNAPKQLWEQGILGFVFNNTSLEQAFMGNAVSQPPRPRRPRESLNNVSTGSVSKVAKMTADVDATDLSSKRLYARAMSGRTGQDEASRRAALAHEWALIIMVHLDGFTLGRLLKRQRSEVLLSDVHESVLDSLGRKASSTVAKRLSSFSMYHRWCLSNGHQVAPVLEHVAYSYARHLLDDAAPPSTGKSFLESLHFSSGVLGLILDDGCMTSPRIKGVTERMALLAPPVLQAAPLTVDQVMKLEKACVTSSCSQDVCTIGGMLVLMYGCARASDGARSVHMDIDLADNPDAWSRGYVELSVAKSKTATTIESKRKMLPVLAPLVTLSDLDWPSAWIDARRKLGMTLDGDLMEPFIPKFGASGEVVNTPALSAELGRILRLCLNIKVAEGEQNATRSHSLKATPLSWASKFGLKLETRRALGHHCDPSARSADLYARDPMGAHVAELERVLQFIKMQKFFPDRPRTARFAQSVLSPSKPPAMPAGDEDSDDVEGLSSDSSAMDTEGSSDVDDVRELPDNSHLAKHLLMSHKPELPPGRLCWRHKVSGVQHFAKPDAGKLLCGRLITANYDSTAGFWDSMQTCATCKQAKA